MDIILYLKKITANKRLATEFQEMLNTLFYLMIDMN